MNEEGLKKVIKQEAQKIEIRTSANDILERYKVEKMVKKKKPWFLSRSFAYGASAFGVLAIALGIGLGIGLNNHASSTPTIAPAQNAILNQASYEILAAVTSGSVDDGTSSQSMARNLKNAFNPYDTDDVADDNAKLKEAVGAFEQYREMVFDLERKSVSQEFYTPIESDDANYAYAIQISDGLILYYNDASFEDKDEEEVNKTYNASLKDGNKTFDVTLEKTVETEGDEVETEISTKIFTDRQNYVEIKESFEEESGETEQTYELTKFVNGSDQTRIKFERETEGRKTEKKFEIEKDPNYSGSYEYKIKNLNVDNNTFTLNYENKDVNYDGAKYVFNNETIYP